MESLISSEGIYPGSGSGLFRDLCSCIARLASIRLVLAVAARNDWEIRMFNFHSAYLNGVLDDGETIYIEQPPHHAVANRSRYVVKLRKSLYGLKQAGRKWYETLRKSLTNVGF